MMRFPPEKVPSPIAAAEASFTQSGTVNCGMRPAASRARAMTPIVFWASFEPWLKAMSAADIVCARRNPTEAVCGRMRRKVQ